MNKPLIMAFALSEAVCLAVIAWLLIENRSLKEGTHHDQAAAHGGATQAAGGTEKTPAEAGGASRIAELEKALKTRDESAKAEKAALETAISDLKKELAAAKTAGEQPDAGIKSLEDILEKHKKALIYGQEIPEDVAKDLGLEGGQAAALKLAIDDELRRMDEAMARFYAANMPDATAEDASKPAKDLILKMMQPISEDMKAFAEMSISEQLKIHTETSLEEILGPDKFLSRLAAEVHAARLQTYRDLERTLSAEQIAKLRAEYLREGLLAYDEQFKLEFGSAPKPK
jgi:hypothetical protein